MSERNTENAESARLTWLGGPLLLICTGSPGPTMAVISWMPWFHFPSAGIAAVYHHSRLTWFRAALCSLSYTFITLAPLYYTSFLHADVLPKPATFWNSAVVSNGFLCIFIQFTGKKQVPGSYWEATVWRSLVLVSSPSCEEVPSLGSLPSYEWVLPLGSSPVPQKNALVLQTEQENAISCRENPATVLHFESRWQKDADTTRKTLKPHSLTSAMALFIQCLTF